MYREEWSSPVNRGDTIRDNNVKRSGRKGSIDL